MAGSQKITLWGPQRTPLGILRVKKVPETPYNITLTPLLIVQNVTVAYDTAINLVQAIGSAPQVYQQAVLRCQNVTSNNLKCLSCCR